MRILFISRGEKKNFETSPSILRQAGSLRDSGVEIDLFFIEGKGIWGYCRSLFRLRRYLNKSRYQILHAHYAFSALLALLACKGIPVVVSYMGSDIFGIRKKGLKNTFFSAVNSFISMAIQIFVSAIIVKSEVMLGHIYCKKKAYVVPNGVDLDKFRDYGRRGSREKLHLPLEKKVILFLGNPEDFNKNYSLLVKAVDFINRKDIFLCAPFPVDKDLIPYYLSSCDLLVLTSYSEGSSNVIKEAMACSRPVVATDAGDAKWLLDGLEGCYLSSFAVEDLAEKIISAINFKGEARGRERLIKLGISSDDTARRMVSVYSSIIRTQQN